MRSVWSMSDQFSAQRNTGEQGPHKRPLLEYRDGRQHAAEDPARRQGQLVFPPRVNCLIFTSLWLIFLLVNKDKTIPPPHKCVKKIIHALEASHNSMVEWYQCAWGGIPLASPPTQRNRCSLMGFDQILYQMRLWYHGKYPIMPCSHSISPYIILFRHPRGKVRVTEAFQHPSSSPCQE